LTAALREVYNLSIPLAVIFTFVGILLCGHGFSLDLDDLAAHNKIEHDASLAHRDAPKGCSRAPITVDPDYLRSFLGYATGHHGLTLDDFARARHVREAALKKPLGRLHAEIGHGEAALAWILMADEHGEVPLATLESWWGDERLPDGWKRPQKTIGLLQTRKRAQDIAMRMKVIANN
jgi:Peroxidase, family 2